MEGILYDAGCSSPYDSLAEVLTKWLKLNYSYEKLGDPSLSPLVKAVDMCDHPLAIKIFQTFTAIAGEPIKVHTLRKVHEIDGGP